MEKIIDEQDTYTKGVHDGSYVVAVRGGTYMEAGAEGAFSAQIRWKSGCNLRICLYSECGKVRSHTAM